MKTHFPISPEIKTPISLGWSETLGAHFNGIALSIGVISKVYPYFQLIADHERVPVETLTAVITSLGGTPVPELCYNFGYSAVDQFVKVAQLLENTGVMAYDGAIHLVCNPDLQTAGATIATVEARHAFDLFGIEFYHFNSKSLFLARARRRNAVFGRLRLDTRFARQFQPGEELL